MKRERERALLVLAVALVLAGSAYAYLTAPTWVSVAVGPAGSPDDKLMRAFARQLGSEHAGIRLKVLPVADVREAAEALDASRAEMAVVRADVTVPDSGLTLAILRDAAAILLSPRSSGIHDLAGLAGKKLGLAVGHEADPAFITRILNHFDLADAVTVVPTARDRLLPALEAGAVDAVAIVASPTGATAAGFVRSVASSYDGQITVLPVETADALVQRSPAMVSITVPEGVWGGRPRRPETPVHTVGVSYRLMARSDADRGTMAAVTEALFQMRSRLAGQARSALLMRAPSTETATSAMLPNHPGAIDYFEREQQSFTDKYGDWIYLGAFFGSGILSALAWLYQRFHRHRREVIDDVLDRLLTILIDARKAESLEAVDELTSEVDALLSVAVTNARGGRVGSQGISALVLAIDGARAAIEDRRRLLDGGGQPGRERRDAFRLLLRR